MKPLPVLTPAGSFASPRPAPLRRLKTLSRAEPAMDWDGDGARIPAQSTFLRMENFSDFDVLLRNPFLAWSFVR